MSNLISVVSVVLVFPKLVGSFIKQKEILQQLLPNPSKTSNLPSKKQFKQQMKPKFVHSYCPFECENFGDCFQLLFVIGTFKGSETTEAYYKLAVSESNKCKKGQIMPNTMQASERHEKILGRERNSENQQHKQLQGQLGQGQVAGLKKTMILMSMMEWIPC